MRIITIESTKPTEMDNYAHGLYDQWEIGKTYDGRGILVILAISDRNWYIATGNGLRSLLPDDRVARIGAGMLPLLKQQRYSEALLRVTSQLAEIIATERGIRLNAMPPQPCAEHCT
jgi:uncharacterized protein